MSKLTEIVKEEIAKMIPPTIFFFIALQLAALIRSLMLRGTGIQIAGFVAVSVSALVLGKAVLIADMLPFINRYPRKPLIYNVAWKTVIYALVSMLIHYMEHLVDFWRETGGFIAGNKKLLSEIVWPHFWAIQIVLVMLIFAYCTMHELARVLGEGKMREMFFRTPSG